MKPTTTSLSSATIPMQLRCRRARMNSSSDHGNSKLCPSISSTAGISRRIIHRIWTHDCSFSARGISFDPSLDLAFSGYRVGFPVVARLASRQGNKRFSFFQDGKLLNSFLKIDTIANNLAERAICTPFLQFSCFRKV